MNVISHGVRRLGQVVARGTLARGFRTSAITSMPIKVGDKIPAVDLFEDNPGNKVGSADLFGSGRHVVFGVVGAFTPTCQQEQAPTFVQDYDKLIAKGVKTVSCISVNDPFVMSHFGKALNCDGKIRMLADTKGDFTKAIDMALDLTDLLGNVRSTRYVLVINDGVVTGVNVEEDPTKSVCTRSTDVLSML